MTDNQYVRFLKIGFLLNNRYKLLFGAGATINSLTLNSLT